MTPDSADPAGPLPRPGRTEAAVAGAASAYPRIVGALIRLTGDWDLAEDCAQEALAAALQRWPSSGVPDNPAAWLMTTAKHRAIDVLRRASVEQQKLRDLGVLAVAADPEESYGFDDDRLRLIFTCCHPALPLEARVALTLRTICNVRTADLARAFMVTEATMTRRLTRAKTKIAQAGIPYRVPQGADLTERLPGVLGVLYVLFTNGYNADGTPAFADEAIHLTRMLRNLLANLSPAPDLAEVTGLLALFLFQHSRRRARASADGRLLSLDRQDRALWDWDAIGEGRALLDGAGHGPYSLQARIAAFHATTGDTDWAGVAACYDALWARQPTPVIALNRAFAHGYAYGPAVGLELLAAARAGGALDGWPHAVAAEADLTSRLGDRARAAGLFREAAALAHGDAERAALLERAAAEDQ
ncbi:sigma-70 family RNA polymerase sigma factor [Dactylosporangium vinaceum]|uniref:RNA polymerase sigma factor n=1 Tax=Dactylosporangium vinaceum TaxID=53362 RepID=A0ABV5MJG6_9ACTN|nr:sigma-70 family RNA polymerase sigma factor [Dactylosporangium vinaceum]